MLTLEQLKKRKDLVYAIDWDMTPEEAVRLYLEWGNNWVHGKYVVRHDSDVSVYFTVYSWEDPPVIFLIRRDARGAEELARIAMPDDIRRHFMQTTGRNNGVYALAGEVKKWLASELENVN